MKRRSLLFFILISFLGFLDSLYLYISHLQNSSVACSFLGGCDIVLSSSYAFWGAVPLAGVGIVYYFLIFASSVAYLSFENRIYIKIALILPLVGLPFSLWFVYLQVFVLHALCFYCIVSAGITALLFIFSLFKIKNFLP